MFAHKFSIPRNEFRRIKEGGRLFQSDNFGVLVKEREKLGNPRFGVIISNKVSKLSTLRNRIRRAFRDTVRRNWKKVRGEIDMVFLVKPSVEKVSVSILMKEIERFIDSKAYEKKPPKS